MPLRRPQIAFVVLIAGLGVSTAVLFVNGLVTPGVLGCAAIACLAGWGVRATRARRPGDPAAVTVGDPRSATAPPDGHIRFTVVVEGLDPDRIAEVWSDLCRPDRRAQDDLRLLFRTFTVVEGPRFRFRKGDPAATAALLANVLAAAAGVPIRTRLEPAAERTPPWS